MGNPPEEKTTLSAPGARRPFLRPDVPEKTLAEWQRALDTMAECLGVPVSLIKRAEFERMVVIVANESGDHPFRPGRAARLDSGVYCETVAARREALLVPNALEDPQWSGGPSVRLGFVSYLGFPLLRPDGELFGTLCVLDRKENEFGDDARELVLRGKTDIERDLGELG